MIPILARTMFRLQERMLGRRSFAILAELRQSERWPRQRLQELQMRRLREVLAAAHEHTSYWRGVMDAAGVRAGDVRCMDDLRRMPLLTKDAIRARREDMVWRDEGRRLAMVRTSGSTNEALPFYTNSNREAHINAGRMRGHEWIGVRRGDKEMYFWGSPIELSRQDRVKRIRDWLINDGLTNGFEIRPESVPAYFEFWKRWRPKCIFGYPCSFSLMAMFARSQGIDLTRLKDHGLKVLSTTSELLTDVDRQLITKAFGVPVYDSFGLREGGLVGHECEHFTMHCMDEQVILETIDPDTLEPTGSEGELVLTNIVSRVMPVIRYRTGDIVTLSDATCPCGRTLSSVKVSGGRAADFVVTSDGKWVAGYFIIYICRSVPGIVKFQLIQQERGRMTVQLVTDGEFPPDGAERVRRGVVQRLASDDRVTVERVPDIKCAPSGKYRPVVGEVARQLRAEADAANRANAAR
jgi:phenylacetate-CoA ligase